MAPPEPRPRQWRCAWALMASLLAPALVGAAPESVALPSLDAPAGVPVMLAAVWLPAGAARAPAVVLLHGCGGAFSGSGQLDRRMHEYGGMLNRQGWHVLVPDSLGPRGERELCTQATGQRRVTMTQRRRDALASLQWLAARADVDAAKLALVGWSNGGSTVLAASNLAHAEVAGASVRPAALAAFYPGCETELKRGYRPSAPLLLLLGGSDDWTSPLPCQALQAQAAPPRPRLKVYDGAYHGFDGRAPLRRRADVPNGVHPGAGVHVGASPEARAYAQHQLIEFLGSHLR